MDGVYDDDGNRIGDLLGFSFTPEPFVQSVDWGRRGDMLRTDVQVDGTLTFEVDADKYSKLVGKWLQRMFTATWVPPQPPPEVCAWEGEGGSVLPDEYTAEFVAA